MYGLAHNIVCKAGKSNDEICVRVAAARSDTIHTPQSPVMSEAAAPQAGKPKSLAALHHPEYQTYFSATALAMMAPTLVQINAPVPLRGRFIGLHNMSSNGLRAFSGITVGILGNAVGIHWSLALSALVLPMCTSVLLAFALRKKS